MTVMSGIVNDDCDGSYDIKDNDGNNYDNDDDDDNDDHDNDNNYDNDAKRRKIIRQLMLDLAGKNYVNGENEEIGENDKSLKLLRIMKLLILTKQATV